MLLTSCQATSSLTGASATEKPETMLLRDVARLFPPVIVSRDDILTYGTACQVIEAQVTYYCTFPDRAPPSFPAGMCAPNFPVCASVLGFPVAPEPTPPLKPLTPAGR